LSKIYDPNFDQMAETLLAALNGVFSISVNNPNRHKPKSILIKSKFTLSKWKSLTLGHFENFMIFLTVMV
jgi:hypothetical protein